MAVSVLKPYDVVLTVQIYALHVRSLVLRSNCGVISRGPFRGRPMFASSDTSMPSVTSARPASPHSIFPLVVWSVAVEYIHSIEPGRTPASHVDYEV